ncbi:septum formation family protein [Nocardioides sp. AE5]|uniref:septum formation family protein n=1 Tax=Nocardioides sp. AE5 TaxID=2962573 RepID=UPI00288147CF|nr:septum formation family protein [Nocardioides sp. AE5]MDT0203328.1 septum formation family protein [Nocardioides sp. AE5]
MWGPKPRSRHLPTRARLAVIGMVLLLPAACSGDDPGPGLDARVGKPASSAPPDPRAGIPEVGQCHLLDPNAVNVIVDTTDPLPDCTGTHTSRTFHVDVVPPGTTVPVAEIAFEACAGALEAGTGLDSAQLLGSFITWLWFEPTPEQKEAGAAWFRCDVVASEGEGELIPLPTGTATGDVFGGTVGPAYKRCIRNGGDTDGDGLDEAIHVACSGEHDYEWSGAFDPGFDTYPSEDEFFARAQDECGRIAGTEDWWSTWPSRDAWEGGEHRISCFRAV